MRIAFMGTPEFAVPVLARMIEAGHTVAAVYTRAPKPAGRGMGLRRSPVHVLAENRGIPVLTPRSLRDPTAGAIFAGHGADVAVVVAYGLILPKAILEAPRFGCLNLHASLLPRWRGAAPIARAVMAGDAETGVMVMRMDEGLDTGPVALARRAPIPFDATAGDMHDRLAALGADLAADALAMLAEGKLTFVPQGSDGITYAHKIDKAESHIDWRRDAPAVHNQIRGLSPSPGAYFTADFGRGPERIKVLRAQPAAGEGPPGTVLDAALTVACGGGAVRLLVVQRAGRAPMTAAELLRGAPVAAGTMLA